jgi:hypothetical protein
MVKGALPPLKPFATGFRTQLESISNTEHCPSLLAFLVLDRLPAKSATEERYFKMSYDKVVSETAFDHQLSCMIRKSLE